MSANLKRFFSYCDFVAEHHGLPIPVFSVADRADVRTMHRRQRLGHVEFTIAADRSTVWYARWRPDHPGFLFDIPVLPRAESHKVWVRSAPTGCSAKDWMDLDLVGNWVPANKPKEVQARFTGVVARAGAKFAFLRSAEHPRGVFAMQKWVTDGTPLLEGTRVDFRVVRTPEGLQARGIRRAKRSGAESFKTWKRAK